MSVIRKKPVLGKNVSVTATPSMTQVAIHGFVASTFASREMCGLSVARATAWHAPMTALLARLA
jgi:hypothetical protein